MTKDHEDRNESSRYEEPSLEDFLLDEEEDEETKKRKKKRQKFIKITAIAIAFGLVFQVVGSLFNMFNLDAIAFLKTSYRLSQQEDISRYKEAVVTIQGERSKGTGFSITEDGLIVTNEHVIRDQERIAVNFPNGELFEGEVIESYTDVDLAFLKVSGKNLPTLPLSEHRGAVDEDIYVIGNPLSFTQIANEGHILESSGEKAVTMISAPIYKGNSGSPVINKKGDVVGVVYAKRRVPGESSVGLAIPIEYVHDRLPEQSYTPLQSK
ncbi:S1C family serine protease [Anaerobacillus sp. MEB173]|uniref:S1C family serine protease n=1 Tax=Anaerobacillus sp. MEB173 TaxID=3383345 RepID=UPI003F93C145